MPKAGCAALSRPTGYGLPELSQALGGQYHSIQTLRAREVVARIAEVLG